jgi:hypothetical protein
MRKDVPEVVRRTVVVKRSSTAIHVALFMIACAMALAAIAPLSSRLAGQWSLVGIGASTSLVAFALSILFARWDRIRLADIGAAIESQYDQLSGGDGNGHVRLLALASTKNEH